MDDEEIRPMLSKRRSIDVSEEVCYCKICKDSDLPIELMKSWIRKLF